MPRKRRKREEEVPSVTLFQFVESKKEEESKRVTAVKEVKKDTELKEVKVDEQGYESLIYNYIRQRGKVSKDEIYVWSKRRKISPAELYRAIISLEKKGLVRKRFDGEMGQLVYEIIT
ncbi:MAG: hypothetical protein DRN04_01130 [Thermoprotei archaeon]|nr:MAG: hypothetical protein DRN04_01130 [Thermoprotei archaeon]